MKLENLQELADSIDVDDLVRRCMGNIDFAARILRLVVDKCTEDICELEQAVARSDVHQAERIAHRLKGALANGSAIQLSQRADVICQMANHCDIEEIARQVAALRDDWDRFSALCDHFD